MDVDSLIQLTANLYRLTLLFPKKEPLRYKMREKAVDILTKPNEKDLEILDSFFEVALVQQWTSSSELLAVKTKYDNLKRELNSERKEVQKETLFSSEKKEKTESNSQLKPQLAEEKETNSFINQKSFNNINQRQEKIIEFLKENGRAQVWQIKEIMPDITKRTLRRDFEYMLSQGLIKRIGERNDTFYQIFIKGDERREDYPPRTKVDQA